MNEKKAKLRIAVPVSEQQHAEVKAPNTYTPIENAVKQCANYIITTIRKSSKTAFTQNGSDWQMIIPPVKGIINADETSYPFTLTMTLTCQGYTPTKSSFTFSRLKFVYSFGFDDFNTSYRPGQTSTDEQGRINDFQFYGDMTKKNTPKSLIHIIETKMIPEFTRSLKVTAEAMLQYKLHPIDNKAKSKTRNGNVKIARQLIKLAKELMAESNEE